MLAACHRGRVAAEDPEHAARATTIVSNLTHEMLGSARVMGLGENSHGTREFRRALHDATLAAIDSHGLAIVMLELGAAYVERLNAWTGGCGPSSMAQPERLDRETLGILHTPAFLAFLDAVARHNAAVPTRCVRLVGIEAGVGGDPRAGLLALVESHLTPAALAALERPLESIRGWTLDRRTLDSSMQRRANDDLAYARQLLGDPTNWTTGAAPPEIAIELPFWLGLCAQRIAMSTDPLQRERFMADNVLFWARTLPSERSALLYAHAFHVTAHPYFFRGREQRSMGTFVRAALGDDYRVVALTFGAGTFLAMQPFGGPRLRGIHVARLNPPSQACLERSLHERGDTPFVFRPDTECAGLGDGCQHMRQIGIVYPIGFHDMKLDYLPIDVARAFDAVVFFPTAHADR